MTRDEIEKLVQSAAESQLWTRGTDSYDIDKIGFLAAGVTSAAYAQRMMRKTPRISNGLSLLAFALAQAPQDGMILEFGVASGRTINFIADQRPKQVFGFDTFTGLPEDWRAGYPRGAFATQSLPTVRDNVVLIKGLFEHTLPEFCTQHEDTVAFAHIDCDIYSGAQTILAHLRDRIVPGTVLVFDEYFNYPDWEMHEFRAFQEFVGAYSRSYEYIGIVAHHQQVAVRILK